MNQAESCKKDEVVVRGARERHKNPACHERSEQPSGSEGRKGLPAREAVAGPTQIATWLPHRAVALIVARFPALFLVGWIKNGTAG